MLECILLTIMMLVLKSRSLSTKLNKQIEADKVWYTEHIRKLQNGIYTFKGNYVVVKHVAQCTELSVVDSDTTFLFCESTDSHWLIDLFDNGELLHIQYVFSQLTYVERYSASAVQKYSTQKQCVYI